MTAPPRGPQPPSAPPTWALYAAKGMGRDRLCFWTPELTEAANRRSQLIQELTAGLTRGELASSWQPQYDLVTGEVVGAESLVRWRHPQHGLLEPGRFLQTAVESGLIVDIGRVMLDEALRAALERPTLPRASVNVSARELVAPGLAAHVVRRLGESGVEPGRLVVEVTEDVVVNDAALAVAMDLKAAGIEISVDDFGTGYSSFARLPRLPLDEIEIDRSLVGPMVEEHTFLVLVRTMVDMARALGVRVVAEGVETQRQRELLQEIGCHLGQGYLLGRPTEEPPRPRGG